MAGGKADGFLRWLGELAGGLDQQVQLPGGLGDKVVADNHPPQQDHENKDKEVVVPHPVEQLVQGIGLVPGDGVADQKTHHRHRQHNGHPGDEGQQVIAPHPQGAVAAPVG